jgi:hypothetical protein
MKTTRGKVGGMTKKKGSASRVATVDVPSTTRKRHLREAKEHSAQGHYKKKHMQQLTDKPNLSATDMSMIIMITIV